MKKIIVYLLLLVTIEIKAQEIDSSKVHFTFQYSNGINGFLNSNQSANIYYNAYHTILSIGIRKELYDKDNFISIFLSYADRGIRRNTFYGNGFLPELKNNFHNHYISLQIEGGFYFKKNWHFKEYIGLDYLIKTNQYTTDELGNFRGVNRFTPSLESGIGNDIKISPKLHAFVDLFVGFTLFKPRFLFIGPRIGIFFKEKDIKVGHRRSF